MNSKRMQSVFALFFCLGLFCGANLQAAAAKKVLTGVVNVNQAGVAELTLLPGVGPKKAVAIVEYAKAHPFKNVEELKAIKGIGDKLLEKLKPYVSVMGPNTLKEG